MLLKTFCSNSYGNGVESCHGGALGRLQCSKGTVSPLDDLCGGPECLEGGKAED